MQLIRLNQYLASCGVCSRRAADELIRQGEVTIDGRIAQVGDKVSGEERIVVSGRAVHGGERRIVVAYYKPVGVTVTDSDPHAEVTLRDVFHYPERLTYAGRLDKDSEGLLLMTNDGQLVDKMMRGRAGHEKEYIVRVRGKITDEDLERLSKGIWLPDLRVKTRPCKVTRLGEDTFRIVLTQGLNRQIRRMCHTVGRDVKQLKRVRVLTVMLGGLKPGEMRELSAEEIAKLMKACEKPARNARSGEQASAARNSQSKEQAASARDTGNGTRRKRFYG